MAFYIQQYVPLNSLHLSCPSPFIVPTGNGYLSVCFYFVIFICFIFQIPHISDNRVSIFLWLISQAKYHPGPSMFLQMTKFHSFLWLTSIPFCLCVSVYVRDLYSFICWWTFRLLPYLGKYEKGCYGHRGIGISFQISVFVFFGHTPMSEISGWYESSIFSFLKTLHTVCHNGCTNYYTSQPKECQDFLFSTSLPIFVIFHPFWWWSFWQVWGGISL